MIMETKTAKRSLLLCIYLVALLLAGCSTRSFKESCLNARSIIKEASKLLTIVDIEDVEDGGKKEGTIVRHENTAAVEYLKSKEEELHGYYETLKSYLKDRNDNYDNALFAMAYINEMLHFISGQSFDDRCYYVGIIKSKGNVRLSDWVLDEFFAPLQEEPNLLKSWHDMKRETKYEMIYATLLTSEAECAEENITERE